MHVLLEGISRVLLEELVVRLYNVPPNRHQKMLKVASTFIEKARALCMDCCKASAACRCRFFKAAVELPATCSTFMEKARAMCTYRWTALAACCSKDWLSDCICPSQHIWKVCESLAP